MKLCIYNIMNKNYNTYIIINTRLKILDKTRFRCTHMHVRGH